MYNANPNYEMNFTILKDVNKHMEGMFQRFSKLLPFRIDFAYPVRIDHVIHYSDKSAVDGLRYALSYLAKQDQKEHGIILMRSRLPEKSNRGRPRHN